jgi:hypothetical protein cdiviTM7_00995
MKIITVLPAYNEEAVLSQLFARLKDLQKTIKKYRLELLFINDGSSDDTLAMIQREAKKILQLLMLIYRAISARKLAC